MINGKTDRRVVRTRSALIHAFAVLFHERHSVDAIRIGEVVERANVGRSTFYEHFKNKEEIFAASFQPMFTVLAGVLDEKRPVTHLIELLDHCWSLRGAARSVFGGTTRRAMSRVLSRALAEQLSRPKFGAKGNRVTMRIASVALAEAQIGAIHAWLAGEISCTSTQLAATLLRVTRSSAGAGLK